MSKNYSLPRLPNIKIIRQAALSLLHTNQEVTTIEVKNLLARKGFLADHAEIIHWMVCIARKEGWQYNFDGKVRTYRLKPYPGYDLCCEAIGYSSN